jgi:hypothetical protein
MSVRTISHVVVLLLCALGCAVASAARAESIFGLSFFGVDASAADARIEGRAGMGLAYSDSVNASVLHPGQLADLERVTVGITSRFENRRASDPSGSVKRSSLATPSIRLGLPLWKQAGIGVGFSALRATQWTVDRPFAGNTDVQEKIEREGTQFVVPLQFGWKLGRHLRVGAGLWAQFSTTRIRYELDLIDDRDVLEVREDIGDGVATELSFGLDDIGPLSLAVHWIGDQTQDVSVRQRGVALSNRADGTRTDSVPGRLEAGFRLELPGTWSAGVDYQVQRWSEYEGRNFSYLNGVYDPNGVPADLDDEITWRFGLEREAARIGVRETLPVRLGAYYRQWHYSLGGSRITEWGVTAGSGVSLSGGRSRVDAAIGYSRIGNQDDNGVNEDLFKVVFSIAGGERWY